MTEADRERLKTDPAYRLEYIYSRWGDLFCRLAEGPKDEIVQGSPSIVAPSFMTAAQRREECARLGQQIKALHEQVGQLRERVRLIVRMEAKECGYEGDESGDQPGDRGGETPVLVLY